MEGRAVSGGPRGRCMEGPPLLNTCNRYQAWLYVLYCCGTCRSVHPGRDGTYNSRALPNSPRSPGSCPLPLGPPEG